MPAKTLLAVASAAATAMLANWCFVQEQTLDIWARKKRRPSQAASALSKTKLLSDERAYPCRDARGFIPHSVLEIYLSGIKDNRWLLVGQKEREEKWSREKGPSGVALD